MGFEELWTFPARLLGFLLTYGLRFFGLDFDWGIL